LTQEEAADRAGIDYKRWQRLESGTVNATLRTLLRVADALGTNVWEMLQGRPHGRR
jgi:transcriptional regulator with XRE-family HTH domain